MGKCKKIKKVPRYAVGGEKFLGMNGTQWNAVGTNLNDAVQVIATPFSTSTAQTGGEAAMKSVQQIGQGAATGMKIGSSFGPYGAAIGAVAGAAVGMIGQKGQKAHMTSFTDYDEGTLGTGLRGAFGNSGLRRERRRIKRNAFTNRFGVQGTNYLQAEDAQENAEMNGTVNVAEGGQVGNLAYVDDGELIQTPDGTITEVPEEHKPTDSNLVNLPQGSRVLSDKIKYPGTNKTIAQVGKELMSKRTVKGNDRFAQGSAKLNEINDNMISDKLFELQELIKKKRGIKPKGKNVMPAYENGNEVPDELRKKYGNRTITSEEARNANEILTGRYTNNSLQFSPEKAPTLKATTFSPITYGDGKTSKAVTLEAITTPSILDSNAVRTDSVNPINQRATVKADTRLMSNPSASGSGGGGANVYGAIADSIKETANIAGSLANIFAGKAKNKQITFNPYAQAITSMLNKRTYNIDPDLEALIRNRAVTNYNMRNINTNTGANMTFALQSAVDQNRQAAALRAQKNNTENTYRAQNSEMMNNLGQQWVQAVDKAEDINERREANVRNIRRQGWNELRNYHQNQELMENQERRDMQMWPMFREYLANGMPDVNMAQIDALWQQFMNNRTSTYKGGSR